MLEQKYKYEVMLTVITYLVVYCHYWLFTDITTDLIYTIVDVHTVI